MCPNIGESSQAEFIKLEGPGFLEMFGAFEMLIKFMQIIQTGYVCREALLTEMDVDEDHIAHAADASIRLPHEVYEVDQWRLVKERIFPSLFLEFEKLCVRAKFLCLRRFAEMAQFNFVDAFLGQLDDSIQAQLFYELTMIMLKDSRDKEVTSQLLEVILADKIDPDEDDDYNSSSPPPKAFFKFWDSLPSGPLDIKQVEGGKQ